MLAGLSYAHTGSLAYPRRYAYKRVPRQDRLVVILDLVHPGNLGALPPSPSMLAYKGEQIGVATYAEFFCEVYR